jgi:hypothetical protein
MRSNSQANRSVIPSTSNTAILSTNRSVILSEGERAFCVPRSRRTPKPPTDPILSDPFSANPVHGQLAISRATIDTKILKGHGFSLGSPCH